MPMAGINTRISKQERKIRGEFEKMLMEDPKRLGIKGMLSRGIDGERMRALAKEIEAREKTRKEKIHETRDSSIGSSGDQQAVHVPSTEG